MSYEVEKFVKSKREDYDDASYDFNPQVFRESRVLSVAGQQVMIELEKTATKTGRELRVGDIVETRWGIDTITALEPYQGQILGDDARIASFANHKSNTVIFPDDAYDLIGAGRVATQ